ncbi:mediator complex, subunit Med18 [Sphaerosporella brunnea]|uniref:Mediator of RNA polymerase II transcription subunit 18 n=1 Tax=Sphaerosporella brunnea TaxID=1250544 RepID=A0A5J5EKV6_9PEZI|nr:mediator complex, subunit Med18 [Sphaerosporella brunnea]
MSHQTPLFPNNHQELSLYAYISDARQPQLLKILSGVTGMAPDTFFNHHLVFKPKPKIPKPSLTSVDLYYIQLVSRVPESQPEGGYKPRAQRWSIRLDDFPEVTRKPVTSRVVYSANSGMGDVIEFMEELGYTLQAPYFTENARFIHNNVIITLTRTYVPSTPPAPTTEASQVAEARAGIKPGDGVFGNPFPREELKLVDQNGGWMMQAAIRVQSNTDVESINVATTELRALREHLKGVCELEVVERLALDTRVR